MDRLSDLGRFAVALLGFVALLTGCNEPKEPAPRTKRFAAVKKAPAGPSESALAFCENVYPADGEGAKRWAPPATRPIPGYAPPTSTEGVWRWINVWASWCGPCLAEMPLIRQWQASLKKDGVDLEFDMWSIDEDEAALVEALAHRGRFPAGPILWLEDPTSLESLMERLGVPADTAIPVHGLVDPNGQLRCVRVGAVKEASYGAIRSIVGA